MEINQANGEPTLREILDSVNEFATVTEEHFEKIENRLTRIEATMVSKDYLDDKLGDLKGDIIVIIRKEDKKLAALIEILAKKSVISANDVKQILTLEPFPQLFA